MPKRSAWIDVIEAAYRIDEPEQSWLDNVLAAAGGLIEQGLGSWAATYDIAPDGAVQMRVPVARNLVGDTTLEAILRAQAGIPPEETARLFQTTRCGTASQVMGDDYEAKASLAWFEKIGVHDTLGLNFRDPTSTGCMLVSGMPKRDALSTREIAVWSKVAAHVTAGFRLQRARAAGASPESRAAAVLTPAGKVEHAEPAAQTTESRARLREAVLAMEAARGRLRRDAPEEAVDRWRCLVSARWTLLDHFEVGGRRYVVARENVALGPPAELTDRERQILSYAALGHHNKLIAYELGIADSTVRVLLARAAAKLGTETRDDTVRAFTAMTRAFGAPDVAARPAGRGSPRRKPRGR